VKSISVSATVDVKHNAEITEGAELLDGKKIQSWDWWSKSWPLNRMLDTFREGSSGEPVLAHRAASLHPPTKTHPSHIYAFANPGDPSNVGYLRFLPVGNDLYVFSLNNATPPKEAYLNMLSYKIPFTKVTKTNESQLFWEFNLVFLGWKDRSKVSLSNLGDKTGTVLIGEGFKDLGNLSKSKSFSYNWVAELVKNTEPNQTLTTLMSFSEKDFVAALEAAPQASVLLAPVFKEAPITPMEFLGIPKFVE
jgi:hypothetical protein